MASCETIRHKLDLALRLIDTVDGRPIDHVKAEFHTRSPGLKAISKEGGIYLFLNVEAKELEVTIHVYGYESREIKLTLAKEEKMAIRDIHLLPLDTSIGEGILTLRGSLSKLEEIEAVSLHQGNCRIKEFDAKKKIMSILNQRNVHFHHTYYGLINKEKTSYERIQVVREISPEQIECKELLEASYTINQPIVRVIFGQVKENGEYILKVANEEEAEYLVRYVIAGNVYYERIDFHNKENVLTAHETAGQNKEERWEQS